MTDKDGPRRSELDDAYGGIIGFIEYAASGEANVFDLVGPSDVPIVFHAFVGYFPGRGFTSVLAREGENKMNLRNTILGLKIPDRALIAAEDAPDLETRHIQEANFNLQGFPSILLAIGEAFEDQQETVYLAVAKGISPETALLEIQTYVDSRIYVGN